MSLLKALQRELTCTDLPWVPRGDPALRRFINEIVLGEECDDDGAGGYASHFEFYLSAMDDAGADSGPVLDFVEHVSSSARIQDALVAAGAPCEAREFVSDTFEIIDSGAAHRIAAAFTLGREEIIADMFLAIVKRLSGIAPERLGRLCTYLQRHIELDGEEYGPLAQRLLENVCGDDAERWHAAESTGRRVLRSRIALWNGLDARIETSRPLA
jgi:hypothetical protein